MQATVKTQNQRFDTEATVGHATNGEDGSHSTNGEDAALKPLAVAAVKGYKHCVLASLRPNSQKSVPVRTFNVQTYYREDF
jgi:hypothetical protein